MRSEAGTTLAVAAMVTLTAVAPGIAATHSPVATSAKKCHKRHHRCRRHKHVIPVPPASSPAGPAAPLPLGEQEVTGRIAEVAATDCALDSYCIQSAPLEDVSGHLRCDLRETYTWTCYGWMEDYVPSGNQYYECDVREIVKRDGYDGLSSIQDISYGNEGSTCQIIN